MRKTATGKWDPAEHFESLEEMAAYLNAALEEDDPDLVVAAIGDIARAKGMSQIARTVDLGREGLHKALSADGKLEFVTVLKVLSALGLRLHVSPVTLKT